MTATTRLMVGIVTSVLFASCGTGDQVDSRVPTTGDGTTTGPVDPPMETSRTADEVTTTTADEVASTWAHEVNWAGELEAVVIALTEAAGLPCDTSGSMRNALDEASDTEIELMFEGVPDIAIERNRTVQESAYCTGPDYLVHMQVAPASPMPLADYIEAIRAEVASIGCERDRVFDLEVDEYRSMVWHVGDRYFSAEVSTAGNVIGGGREPLPASRILAAFKQLQETAPDHHEIVVECD